MKNIAVFASGSGTNAENIHNYFLNNNYINIKIILTNNRKAYVIESAKKNKISCFVFTNDDFYKNETVLKKLIQNKIDLIVLAGFIKLVPENIIERFPKKIINIHPALLPKYGGKGMFGDSVHKAVLNAKEKKTGITVHYVNKEYDKGEVIMQKTVQINNNDTCHTIAQKVHYLEYKFYPKVIEQILKN